MTKNRQIAEVIFNKIKEFGFEPYDIEYGNGYFIFEMGDDSVAHFRVKGVMKHWKFGIWIQSEYLDTPDEEKDKYPMVSIFAQYDTQIDKFKPSRSELCVEYKASEWTEKNLNNEYMFWELERMLKMMKRHPFMCYCGYCGNYVGYADENFLARFIRNESQEYIERARKAIMTALFLPYTVLKIFFAKRAKCVKNIELYDFEKEHPGWSTSYLYEVKVVFAKGSTDAKMSAWVNKWFKKKEYGKYDSYHRVISIDGFKIDGEDGLFYFDEKERG